MRWLLLLMAVLAGRGVLAQEPAAAAPGSPVSVPIVAVTAGYPPYADSRLPEGGALVAMVRAAFQAAGQPVRLQELPGNRAMNEVATGQVQAAFPLARTAARLTEYQFSQPLGPLTTGAFVPLAALARWRGVAGHRGHSLCVPSGWPTPGVMAEMVGDGQVTVLPANDMTGCVRMLSAGRVDLIIHDPVVIWTIARQLQVERKIALAQRELSISALYMMARRGDPAGQALLAALERGMAILKSTGEYDRLMRPVMGLADR